MLQKLFEGIIQAFAPPPKKSSRAPVKARPASKGERRKKPRVEAKDRRKSKLRIQDWDERDTTRRKSGNFIWEGYIPK